MLVKSSVRSSEDGSAREIFFIVKSSPPPRLSAPSPRALLYDPTPYPVFHDSAGKQCPALRRSFVEHNTEESFAELFAEKKTYRAAHLRDYYFRSNPPLSSAAKRVGTGGISAVRMPHTHDPLRRSFEYLAWNNEKPLFRWFSSGVAGYFSSAMERHHGGCNKDDVTLRTFMRRGPSPLSLTVIRFRGGDLLFVQGEVCWPPTVVGCILSKTALLPFVFCGVDTLS